MRRMKKHREKILFIAGIIALLSVCGGCSNKEVLVPVRDQSSQKYGFIDQNAKIQISCEYEACYPFKEEFAVVCIGDKEGVIDRNGKIVIPIEYDSVQSAQSMNGYFIVYEDGKYGLLSKEGEIIIPLEYENITICNDSYAWVKENGEMLLYDIGRQEKKKLFPDIKIQAIIPVSEKVYAYTTGELIWQPKLWSEKWGMLDIDGHILFEEKYDEMVKFVENRAIAYTADENEDVGTTYLLNEKGEVLKEFPGMMRTYDSLSQGYVCLVDPWKGYGVIDADGNWVLEYFQSKGMLAIQGEVICDIRYSERVYYDLNGNELFETDMDKTEYMDGYIVFEDEEEGSGLMNLSGEIVTRFPDGLEVGF